MATWKAKEVQTTDRPQRPPKRKRTKQAHQKALESVREHMENGRYEEAIALLQPLLEQDEDAALLHMVMGSIRLRQGELDSAIEKFSEALQLRPSLEDAYVRMASAYMQRKETDKAIDTLQEALRYHPQSETLLLSLARIHRRRGDTAQARKMIDTTLAYDPRSYRAYAQLSLLYQKQGEETNMLDACERSIELAPDEEHRAAQYRLLARLHEGRNDHSSAAQAYEEALRLHPASASAKLGLARAYKEMERLSDARDVLVTLAKEGYTSGFMHFLLAEVLYLEGKYALACDQYRAALLNARDMLQHHPELKDIAIDKGASEQEQAEAYRNAFSTVKKEWETKEQSAEDG